MADGVRARVIAGSLFSLLALAASCSTQSGTSTVTRIVPTTVVATLLQPAVTIVVKEPAATVTVSAQTTGPASQFRDGQYIVGRDIQPGTYRASSGSDICYWERQNSDGDVIGNAFGTIATIRVGDFSFQSNRCGSWTRID